MEAVWKKPVNGMSLSPRSAAAAPSSRRRQALTVTLLAGDGGDHGIRTPRGDHGIRTPRGDHGIWTPRGDHGIRTPRGYVPIVLVGDDEEGRGSEERIMVRVEMLKEPRMAAVLEMAAQQFGYCQPGVLRIPCGVDQFQQMVGAECEA